MENDKEQGPFNVNFAILKDDSYMPYGAHQGKAMANVPATYLMWLYDNNKCSKSVTAYIVDNMAALCKETGRKVPSTGLIAERKKK